MLRPVAPLVVLCLSVACHAQSGVLVVESEPARAVVDLYGVRAGRTPLRATLPAGEHELRVLYAGYAPFLQRVVVPAGDSLVVRVALERLTGRVSVRGLPPGATATLDGAPDVDGAVPTGEATVVVTAPGRRPLRAVVPVVVDAETVVAYRRRTFDAATLALAATLPGSPQVRDGRALVGSAVVVGLAAGLTGSVLARGEARRARASTDDAYGVYRRQVTEAGALAAWADVEREVGRERRARRLAGASLGAAAAVYLAGLADAVVHHVRPPGLRVVAPRPAVTAGPAGTPGVGVALTF